MTERSHGRVVACASVASAVLSAFVTATVRPYQRSAPPPPCGEDGAVQHLRARVAALEEQVAGLPPRPGPPPPPPATEPPLLMGTAGKGCAGSGPLPYLCGDALCKPYAFLIGAQKAATSALAHIISANPRLRMTSPKEVKFFVDGYDVGYDNRVRGLSWYLHQLPRPASVRPNRGLREGQVIIDGSATYIAGVKVAEDVVGLFPWARVVVCLRDPVERAFSMWRMKDWYTNGGNGLKAQADVFLRDLRKERAEYAQCMASLPLPLYTDGEAFCESRSRNLERGAYVKQLRRWVRAVGPQRTLVLFSTDVADRPLRILRAVEDFMCAPRADDVANVSVAGHFNVGEPGCRGWVRKSNHTDCRAGAGVGMSAAARRFLTDYYREYDRDLAAFLGLGTSDALPWHKQ
eukprot:TRINITY_DN7151_c1_g1_i1.p1 TRINITY_DN7151_c1_g1~~TRINITY_DN7151_c1_g1_i1.p1  ORF type:complete len:405 (+),score=100.75 TRINITY_DN7151_c1_g1_i1:90-1304(+)